MNAIFPIISIYFLIFKDLLLEIITILIENIFIFFYFYYFRIFLLFNLSNLINIYFYFLFIDNILLLYFFK